MNALLLMSSGLIAGQPQPPVTPAPMPNPVQTAPASPAQVVPAPAVPAHVVPGPVAGCDGCNTPTPCNTCCEEKPNLLSKLRARFGSGSRWKKRSDCDCPPACDCGPAYPTGCALPPAPGAVIVAPPTTAPNVMPGTVVPSAPAPKPSEPKKDTTEKKSSKLTSPAPLVVPAGNTPKPVPAPLGGSGSPF